MVAPRSPTNLPTNAIRVSMSTAGASVFPVVGAATVVMSGSPAVRHPGWMLVTERCAARLADRLQDCCNRSGGGWGHAGTGTGRTGVRRAGRGADRLRDLRLRGAANPAPD